jgi:glycerol-3-phosphate cytidylyltransferase
MKIGFTFSSFDKLNGEDVVMLKKAKKQCDYLIVCLQLHPSINKSYKSIPSKSIIERYIQLKGSKYVDEIIPYVLEQDVEDVLRSFKIDVCIIGQEYKTVDFSGKEYCKEKGIEIYYNL